MLVGTQGGVFHTASKWLQKVGEMPAAPAFRRMLLRVLLCLSVSHNGILIPPRLVPYAPLMLRRALCMQVRKAKKSSHNAMHARRYEAALGGRPERLASGSDDFTMFLWEPSSSDKPLARMTGHLQLINQARAGRRRCQRRAGHALASLASRRCGLSEALVSLQAPQAAVRLASGAVCSMIMSPGGLLGTHNVTLQRCVICDDLLGGFGAALTHAAPWAGQVSHAQRPHMQVCRQRQVATGPDPRAGFCINPAPLRPQVQFSPDGRWVVSASFDKALKLWDGVRGTLHAEL
jgi:hypothetical protein